MTIAARYRDSVQAVLNPLRDERRAAAMAAYMKGQFAFLGIPTPARRLATKAILRPDPADVHDIVRLFWEQPHREYHYVALDLLAAMAKKLDPQTTLTLIEELSLQNSWWDSVDGFAAIASGVLHRNADLRDIVWRWSAHPSFWINRLAILHQKGWGRDTDTRVLFELCLAHAGNGEFFIRKAIGWALRDYAWVDGAAVQDFATANRDRLSNLSVRQALKNVSRAA